MRHYRVFLKTAASPTLALLVLMNSTSNFGESLERSAAADFAFEASYSGNVTLPNPAYALPAAPASGVTETTRRNRVVEAYGRLPLSFEANQGQTHPRVKFLSRRNDSALFLTATEAVLVLQGPALKKATASRRIGPAYKRRGAALRIRMAGASVSAPVEGMDERSGKSNYFIGRDRGRWRANIPNYDRVRYRGIYPGVDLLYYGNSRGIEFDFVVAAGADYRKIQLAIDGAQKCHVDAGGDLVLTTAVGEVRQHKPSVYQDVDGARRAISARYVFSGKHRVGFKVGKYDASRPLVIDPVLDYSTYLGGTSTDEGRSITLDGTGNAYATGRTTSFNFPVTIDAFNTTYANAFDVFVTKLNAAGSDLVYSTYLGGNSEDNGLGISVDSTGNAYVTGSTSSTAFPTTPGAFQTTFRGGSSPGDAFVTKLNSTGTALVYSTFLGGTSSDQAAGIALDSSGNAFVTGFTNSSTATFPTTPGAFQVINAGGGFPVGDAFITKLNNTGTALIYSTFLGGARADQGAGIVVDSSGRAFVTGSTNSTDFDVTAGAFQTTFGGSSSISSFIGDAFVTELNDTGTALIYSTYAGGTGDDGALGLALKSSGEASICGSTTSFNFPVTPTVVRVSNGGAAKSTDAASSWSAINAGLTDSTVLSTAIDPATPSTVFVGTNQGGVFKSTNGGLNWTARNSGLTTFTIRSLAIDPTTPSTIYLGTNSRGVFKTTDGGNSWRAVNTGQGGSAVNALAIDPSNTSVLYAGTEVGAFKSTNGGANWSSINTGTTSSFIHTLAIDPVNPSNLYAGTFSGVFLTKTGGQSWGASGLSSGTIRALKVDPLFPATLYAGGETGVFKSTDAGTTWRSSNGGLANRTVNALAIDPLSSSVVYAGTGNGVFKSTDGGDGWGPTNSGLAGSVINTLALDPVTPANIIAGAAYGMTDGFVAKLDAAGAALLYSTYLGGSNFDISNGIAIDSADNAYVTGQTNSTNFPTTSGTFQSLSNGFDSDAYVTKLNATGAALVYSTYLGGSNSGDQGFAIAADSSGHAYVIGTTNSSNFPTTPGAFQTVLGGNPNNFANDAFIVKLNETPSLTADLRISMTGPNETLTPGAFISYSITLTNDAPEPAFFITVTDQLPPSTTFRFCSGLGSCSGAGNTISFTLNSLAPGATVNGTIFADVTCSVVDGSTLTNTINVESLTPDSNPSNNMASVSNTGSNPRPTISPTAHFLGIGGGSGTVNVFTQNSCPWTAISNASWITITSASTCCNGQVNYTVAANPGIHRVGTITIAGNTLTVTQGGANPQMTIGVYLPGDRTFYLRNSNSPGFADLTIQYGPSGATPVVGDWDGDGSTTIGIYDPGSQTFYLRNSNTPGFADVTVRYGPPGAIPLAGDWNGDGVTTIGVYDPGNQTFYLRNSNSPGAADFTFQFGPPGAVPVVGDWDGSETTTIGVYDSSSQTFYLRNSNTGGFANLTIRYGPSGATPVVGDWDGNGVETIGVYDPASQTFYLRNTNSVGLADLTIRYGPPGAIPLAGDWNGL